MSQVSLKETLGNPADSESAILMDEPLNQKPAADTADIQFDVRRALTVTRTWIVANAAELGCALMLTLMALQMLAVISRKSITVDEIVMIPSAYYHLAAENFQLVNEHPPLSKIVAAVPLLFVQPEEVRPDQATTEAYSSNSRWAYQESFWANNYDRFDSLSFWPRAAMIVFAIALGFLVFRFARELFGARAAVLAVVLLSLEPTILAHGRVVQTDMPAAFGYLLFFMALYSYTHKTTWRRAAWLGAAAGIAILAKFSMLLVGPVLAAFFIASWWRAQRAQRRELLIHISIVLTSALLVVNAAYFFQHPALTEYDFPLIQAAFPVHSGSATTAVRLLSHLLPKDLVLGIIFQFSHNKGGHSAGLLGMYSETGWWYYFPVAFALKTTLPFLLLSLSSLTWGMYQWFKKHDRRFIWLVVPFAIYTSFVLFSHIDIGVRYYLPAYPFLFILAAAFLDRLLKSNRAYRAGALVTIALLAWIGAEAVRAFPNHMSYMNQLASRSPHWWYLSDSNVEWGDDLRALASYLHQHGETRVRDATLGGFFTLHFCGIERVDALTALEHSEGIRYTAVGASYLNGSTIPWQARNGRELTYTERVNLFAAYRDRVPEAVFGGSIYLFSENHPSTR